MTSTRLAKIMGDYSSLFIECEIYSADQVLEQFSDVADAFWSIRKRVGESADDEFLYRLSTLMDSTTNHMLLTDDEKEEIRKNANFNS